jgi:hypothetical protein
VTELSWEGRRPNEPTADYLGRVLDEFLGLQEMAARARAAHFDDYFAPPDIADGLETLRLVRELHAIARGTNRAHRLRIREVVAAVKSGEFDGTRAESDRWAASKDGQEAMRMLAEDAQTRGDVERVKQAMHDPEQVRKAAEAADRLVGDDE